jgi:hypothetical protein
MRPAIARAEAIPSTRKNKVVSFDEKAGEREVFLALLLFFCAVLENIAFKRGYFCLSY